LQQWLTERHLLSDVIQHHLHRAQQRMKSNADKGRNEHEFKVGDMVYLRLQTYIQSLVVQGQTKSSALGTMDLFWLLNKWE
jgi:exosome complex RNA-binding protein Rrp4